MSPALQSGGGVSWDHGWFHSCAQTQSLFEEHLKITFSKRVVSLCWSNFLWEDYISIKHVKVWISGGIWKCFSSLRHGESIISVWEATWIFMSCPTTPWSTWAGLHIYEPQQYSSRLLLNPLQAECKIKQGWPTDEAELLSRDIWAWLVSGSKLKFCH